MVMTDLQSKYIKWPQLSVILYFYSGFLVTMYGDKGDVKHPMWGSQNANPIYCDCNSCCCRAMTKNSAIMAT